MEDIDRIYSNHLGIAFFWKNAIHRDTIQLVFKDVGFHITKKELNLLKRNVLEAAQQKPCKGCEGQNSCRSILLKTHTRKISLAISREELNILNDLVNGTLFHLNLKAYLKGLSLN